MSPTMLDTQWSIATVANGMLGTTGPIGRPETEIRALAEKAPTLTITGDHPDTGDRCRLTDVGPLVYWEPDDKVWIFADCGWAFTDVQHAQAADGPGRRTTRNPARA